MTSVLFEYHHNPELQYECKLELSFRHVTKIHTIYNSGTLWACYHCMKLYCKLFLEGKL